MNTARKRLHYLKPLAVLLWLLVPVGLCFFHFLQGEEKVLLEKAATDQHLAERAEASKEWEQASELYTKAAAGIPEGRLEAIRAGLLWRSGNARMLAGDLKPAVLELQEALKHLPGGKRHTDLEGRIRRSLAEVNYYSAWILRLENAPREKWLPHADSARQHLKVLAEAMPPGRHGAVSHATDLETVVRFTRLDIEELKKLPVPERAGQGARKGMQGNEQKGEGEGEGEQEGDGEGKGPPKDNPGNKGGEFPRPEGMGS